MELLAAQLDLLMFLALCAGILLGYPVVFTLAGVAVGFAFLGTWLGVFDLSLLRALAQRIFGIMTNNVLIAIPLFVLMGVVLERSRIAEELLEGMGRLFGTLRGGLGVSVTVVGALLAASTGIVGATVVTMGLIALPAMLRTGYDPRLAAGTVCAAGTLGQIIPPSTMLIILSEVMSTAYQQAQFRQGVFSVQTLSVGQVFAAALLPGLMLVGLYIAFLLARALFSPQSAPPVRGSTGPAPGVIEVAAVLVPPVLLIVAVLGSILGGVATPSEAAAVGAIGAFLLAGMKLAGGRSAVPMAVAVFALVGIVILASVTTIRLQRSDVTVSDWALGAVAMIMVLAAVWGIVSAIVRTHRAGMLGDALRRTMTISAMIFATIIGASVFALVFRGLGGDDRIEEFLTLLPGGADGALLFVMILIFLLGFVLDFVEISVIILPIVGPILLLMGLDPIWLAVLIAINLQTSFLTPPFGFSLFYLRGAAPPGITTGQIYRGVLPFIALQALAMLLIWFFPAVATTLPRWLFG